MFRSKWFGGGGCNRFHFWPIEGNKPVLYLLLDHLSWKGIPPHGEDHLENYTRKLLSTYIIKLIRKLHLGGTTTYLDLFQ